MAETPLSGLNPRAKAVARSIAKRDNCDIYFYNGTIERGSDLDFMYCVNTNKTRNTCRLILITDGGDPDAAYKIATYLQDKFATVQLMLSGKCKSAGTLVAIGATELIFSPYGEMGPLDVQVPGKDRSTGMSSVLNLTEGFSRLEQRSLDTYTRTLTRILGDQDINNLLNEHDSAMSFDMAASAASQLVQTLYGPVFGRLDLEEVGSRMRTLKIAKNYGNLLNRKFGNMLPDAIDRLMIEYTSHSFVIDEAGARQLFKRVRRVDDLEYDLIGELGDHARWQIEGEKPVIEALSGPVEAADLARPPLKFDFSDLQASTGNGSNRERVKKAPVPPYTAAESGSTAARAPALRSPRKPSGKPRR